MKSLFYLVLALGAPQALLAQEDIPLLLPEERSAVETQSEEFNEALSPALATVARSTVRVWSGSRRLAYGTVVGNGTQVLSKWSEVSRGKGVLRVGAGGDYRGVTVVGVYEEEDLVLLNVEGTPLVPIEWSLEKPALGSFIAAPQPDGKLAAFGVVSVLERNLRDTDMAFLGVTGDPEFSGQGVRISEVEESSGAKVAGLKPGDTILKVGSRAISGIQELKNSLIGVSPGTTVTLSVDVDGQLKAVPVLLGNRPDFQVPVGDRLRLMERMGGPISQVRDSFTHAIQSDMRPKPNQIGGPVVDLKGRALGITIARADRTRSFVMPAAAVIDLLKQPPSPPRVVEEEDEVQSPRVAFGNNVPRGRARPGAEDRMRRQLSDMQRLMEHLQAELDSIEGR